NQLLSTVGGQCSRLYGLRTDSASLGIAASRGPPIATAAAPTAGAASATAKPATGTVRQPARRRASVRRDRLITPVCSSQFAAGTAGQDEPSSWPTDPMTLPLMHSLPHVAVPRGRRLILASGSPRRAE